MKGSLEAGTGQAVASFQVDDTNHAVTYRCDGVELDGRPDALLAAGLPIAMRKSNSLTIPDGASPRMLAASPRIQNILSVWDRRLHRVPVVAPPGDGDDGEPGRATAMFFTGGVDSFYSVLRHGGEIDTLIYVHGFDLALDETAKREVVSRDLRSVASRLGLSLIEVETDLRNLSNRVCNWGRIYTSAALASVAHLLAGRFRRFLIPATHSYLDLHPTGTHPLLDPLWSSERVKLEHVDAVSRVEKLELLAGSEIAMDSLRVCFAPGEPDLNCGRCNKCLRTMTGLRIVGALARCQTLPDEVPLHRVARVPIRGPHALTYVRENLRAAEARGNDPDLVLALRHLVRRGIRQEARAERRQAARDLAGTVAARVARRSPKGEDEEPAL